MRTSIVVPCLAVFLLLTVSVATAAAQAAPPTHPFVIHALAGLTFGPSGGVFGAGAGADVAAVPGLTVFGEFGRLTNVMTSDLQDIVDDLAGVDESDEFDFEFDISLPATYGVAGARFAVPTNGPLGVFVEAGVGFASVGIDVTLVVDGEDFSDDFQDFLERENVTETTTEALFIVGGGVSWPLTPRASVTGGLRINRIAAADGLTKAAAYVGLLWRP